MPDTVITQAMLDTERELRLAAEKDFRDLIVFLKGGQPESYNLHVKVAAEQFAGELRDLRTFARAVAKAADDRDFVGLPPGHAFELVSVLDDEPDYADEDGDRPTQGSYITVGMIRRALGEE